MDVAIVRSALKSVVDIEMVEGPSETAADSNHDFERLRQDRVGIGFFVVLALDLETTVHTNTNFVCSRLLELVKNQLEYHYGRKNSRFTRRYLRRTLGAERIATIEMLVKRRNPFTTMHRFFQRCAEAARTLWISS
jgi:hypothetical protein